MLADEVDYVVGVDTHRDQHVLAVVVASTGAVLAQDAVETNTRGYQAALRFVSRHAAPISCAGMVLSQPPSSTTRSEERRVGKEC